MTDYITASNFKTRIGRTDSSQDARIAAHITSASLEIDGICHRQFGPHAGVATARYFFPYGSHGVRIDDAYEITSVAIDLDNSGLYATTLATSDYVTLPLNGIGPNRQPGFPADALELVTSTYCLPRLARPSVKVTAKWGWAAIPTDVAEACYLITNRLYYEVAVPSGTTPPMVDFGLPGSPLQPQYTAHKLLRPYERGDAKVGVAG